MLEVCRLVLRSSLSFLYSFLFGREGGAGVDSALPKSAGACGAECLGDWHELGCEGWWECGGLSWGVESWQASGEAGVASSEMMGC